MKNWIFRTANLALWLAFCLLTGTGLMLTYRLPPGSRGGHGLTVWGWSRHEWGDVHFWTAIGMIVLVIIHFALNWKWMQKIAASSKTWRLVAGLALGLGIVAVLFLLPVRQGGPGLH